jgi:hypothetical protein
LYKSVEKRHTILSETGTILSETDTILSEIGWELTKKVILISITLLYTKAIIQRNAFYLRGHLIQDLKYAVDKISQLALRYMSGHQFLQKQTS